MKKEQYKIIESHSLIITTNDLYDSSLGEYVVIPNIIKKVFHYLLSETSLVVFYKENIKNQENNKSLFSLKLNKLLSNEIVVFNKFNIKDLEEDYILELAVIGIEPDVPLENIFSQENFKKYK